MADQPMNKLEEMSEREKAAYWYDECLAADVRERKLRDALKAVIEASDQFVRDTGMAHGDLITDAVAAARPLLQKPRNDLAPRPALRGDVEKPRGTYVPFTEHEIKMIRACLDDGTYTRQEQNDFGKLCDMAVNCLLYGQEIERLRGTADRWMEHDRLSAARAEKAERELVEAKDAVARWYTAAVPYATPSALYDALKAAPSHARLPALPESVGCDSENFEANHGFIRAALDQSFHHFFDNVILPAARLGLAYNERPAHPSTRLTSLSEDAITCMAWEMCIPLDGLSFNKKEDGSPDLAGPMRLGLPQATALLKRALAKAPAASTEQRGSAEVTSHARVPSGPAESALSSTEEKPENLRGEARQRYIHDHDCPKVWDFWRKHALGSKLAPSCLLCGQLREREEWEIKHAELPDIFICKPCFDAARSAPSSTACKPGCRLFDGNGFDWCAENEKCLLAERGVAQSATADTPCWLVENGKLGAELRYRTMVAGLPEWTADAHEAIRFARRKDAEMFAAEDDEAWGIVQHLFHTLTPPEAARGSK